MKKVINLLAFLLINTLCLAGGKKITFDKKFEIMQVEESNKFVSVRLYDRSNQRHSAILYDKSGNEVQKFIELKGNCLFAGISEKYNLWVIVIQGGAAYPPDTPETPDKIYAYDIKNKNLVWQSEAVASSYVMSPDGSYLATAGQSFERRSVVEVINLKNGNRDELLSQHYLTVVWYENNKLVVVQPQARKENNEWILHKNRRAKLENEQLDNKFEFQEGRISKEIYDKKKQELQTEINNLITRIDPNSDNPFQRGATRIYIIDVRDKNQELTKDIYLQNNMPFSTSEFNQDLFGVDKEKNIYLYGFTYEGRDRKALLIKIDRQGDILWEFKIDDYFSSHIKMIEIDHDVYFLLCDVGFKEYHILDKNSAEPIPIDDFERKTKKLFQNRDCYKTGKHVLKKYKSIEVLEKDNQLSF